MPPPSVAPSTSAGSVAIHLRLEEIDHVERRDQEDRHEHRGDDETGCDEHDDEREAEGQRPAELLELSVPEMREERREDRRL